MRSAASRFPKSIARRCHVSSGDTLTPDKVTANTSSATDYELYGFDANGNVISHRKRNGQTVTLAYDNLNRLLTRSYPSTADNVSFSYENGGT